jgi:protein-S-isoprenylcysteine O-methyltransferase Ste14
MSVESRRRERKEVTLLLTVLALPALVFWAVTLEAVFAPSGPAVLVAGSGALACTFGYACLAWRTRTHSRSRSRARALVNRPR